MSKSTRGARVAGIAGLAVSLSVGVAAPAFAVPNFAFDRIGGEDRYETAADVADVYGNKPDAIIANGQPGRYADALAANYLAKVKDAPILLTRLAGIPSDTTAQLEQMGAKNVWVVGGESVVPASQVAELQADGYTVTRIAGADRYETDAKVIAENGPSAGGVGLIATGQNFPDALAAGPFAYQGHSLGLTRTNTLPDVVGDALEADGVKEVLIFGGTDAVGAGVVSDLTARGITVKQRFAGADRSETSELAAEWAVKNLNFTNRHLGVASGYTQGFGADALAGGPLEGKEKAPMLITRNVDNPDDVLDYLKAHCQTLDKGHLFGGPAAISAAAEDAMEKAAQCALPGATTRPELVSATVVGTTATGQATPTNPVGTTIRYTFDEPVANAGGLVPVAGNFHAYNTGATQYTGNDVVSVSGNEVVVRFTALNTTTLAGALTVATVDEGAVRQTDGESNIIGDAALGSASGGATTTLPAGITVAPDLVSVGNFRQAENAGDTAVDFTFDEAARTTAAPVFRLIKLDGTILELEEPANGDNTAGGGTVPGGNGTTTITVVYNGPAANTPLLTAADIARGVVAEGSVAEQTNNETAAGLDTNELQAADVSNSGNTTTDDLVSVALRPDTDTDGAGPDTDVDKALFTFDEAVTAADATDFFLYKVDGTAVAGTAGSAEINGADPTQVLVSFGATGTDNAVGGNIVTGAADDNLPDEAGVANSSTGASQTPGRTAAPDLTAVALSDRTSGGFGTVIGTYATYTFDEVVDGIVAEGDFALYLANGTRLSPVAASCEIGPAAGTADDNTVRCAFAPGGTPVSNSYAKAAVVGAVDDGAVDDAAGTLNPEGAEFTTGGTGTPAS